MVPSGTLANLAAVAFEKAWEHLDSFRSQIVVLARQQSEVVETVKVVADRMGIVGHLLQGFGGKTDVLIRL